MKLEGVTKWNKSSRERQILYDFICGIYKQITKPSS